jgi:Transglutaminase-like superfamily
MQVATNAAYSLQSEPLLPGDDGTVQTVRKIRELVDQGKKDPFVNRTTGEILRRGRVRPYDERGEVRAIFEWVLRNIRFTKDPEGKECLRPARTTLEWGFGDCDDINAILLPAMLGTVGYRVRLVTIASHPADPSQFTHVYCEVHLEGRWTPIDAARKNTKFGEHPKQRFRHRIWSLVEDEYKDLRGLGCSGACQMRRRLLGTHARGLGQFDWGAFSDIVNAAGKATSSIITAARAPGGIVYPSAAMYPSPYGVPGAVSPYGTVSPYGVPTTGSTVFGSLSGNTGLILGLGLVGVLLVARR